MIKLTEEREKELEALCRQFRIDIISILHELQTGHAGGSLSECEILVTLYMECANISIKNQYDSGRDRIVLPKDMERPCFTAACVKKAFFQRRKCIH